MRWLLVIVIAIWAVTPTLAQPRPPGYERAAQVFHDLDVDQRLRLQVLLTAAGYWPAVPNENFNVRILRAISSFQSDHGYPPTGWLSEDQFERLFEAGMMHLRRWNFRTIAHPTRGRPIWIPMGLGLNSERTKAGLRFNDPAKRMFMEYEYFDNVPAGALYQHLLAKFTSEGSTIHFKLLKDDFFVISSSHGNINSYIRYHQDGSGVLGFGLYWRNEAHEIHGERIATLVSGSLWALMTGARFTPPPPPPREREKVAAVEPEPKSQPPQKESEKQRKSTSGTGFFVTSEGHIITNNHVVEACSTILVKRDQPYSVPARLLARDSTNDLALLKVDQRASKVASIRTGVRLGEAVAAFGFPLADVLASSGNFTLGNITALAGVGDDTRHIQISAPVQPGNSGGPLLDENGSVIGVVSAKLNAIKTAAINGDIPQNVNFAIKASTLASFLDSNRVSYGGTAASQRLAPPDLADHAKAISVFIRCD